MKSGVRSLLNLSLASLFMTALVMAGAFAPSAAAEGMSAARFSLVIDGAEVGSFAEATGLPAVAEPGDSAPIALKKLPGKRTPPTVTLKRGMSSTSLLRWASLPPGGGVVARKSASLVMYNVDGKPVARYHLEHAWPSKIEIGALKAGASEVLMETVTMVCEHIQRVAP